MCKDATRASRWVSVAPCSPVVQPWSIMAARMRRFAQASCAKRVDQVGSVMGASEMGVVPCGRDVRMSVVVAGPLGAKLTDRGAPIVTTVVPGARRGLPAVHKRCEKCAVGKLLPTIFRPRL